MTSRGDWVRVESIDELTPGTAVKVLDCGRCRGACLGTVLGDVEMLTGKQPNGLTVTMLGVRCTPCAHGTGKDGAISDEHVAEGTVYRLVLPPEATDDAEAVTREREMAR